MSCGLAAKRPHSDYDCDETDSPLAIGIKRLRLHAGQTAALHAENETPQPVGSREIVMHSDSHSHRETSLDSATSCAQKPVQEDSPQFTLRQVKLICERALKEQEQRLRREFETVLNKKLEEQEVAYTQQLREQLGVHHAPDLSCKLKYFAPSHSLMLPQSIRCFRYFLASTKSVPC